MLADLVDLIEAGDVNALLRAVDALCEQRAWDALVDLADRCEEAVERGKQLWPIAAHIDYRLALEGPGDVAAQVLDAGTARFAHGPLTEVAASSHTWAELAPHLEGPQVAAYVAQERVLRGENLVGADEAHPEVLELPLVLQDFEPTYALATFHASYVEVAEPWETLEPTHELSVRPADPLDESELEDALLDLVLPWTAESNGAARAVVVEGDAVGAASMLASHSLRMGLLTPAEALQRLAWAASSGGAHGRRRGAAFGRFAAWYTAALLGDLPWPVAPDALAGRLRALTWYRWDEGDAEQGWVLRIAVEDTVEGWAAALSATDVQDDDRG